MRRKILIAGFSGSGKSSLLEALKNSESSGWIFTDLDQLILRNHGENEEQLSALIQKVGWEKFRLWERRSFESLIKSEEKEIIAIGGGALSPLIWELYGKSRSLQFCHLSVPFEVAWKRLNEPDEEIRPLVKMGKSELKQIYDKRMEIFKQIEWQLDGTLPINSLIKLFWEKVT